MFNNNFIRALLKVLSIFCLSLFIMPSSAKSKRDSFCRSGKRAPEACHEKRQQKERIIPETAGNELKESDQGSYYLHAKQLPEEFNAGASTSCDSSPGSSGHSSLPIPKRGALDLDLDLHVCVLCPILCRYIFRDLAHLHFPFFEISCCKICTQQVSKRHDNTKSRFRHLCKITDLGP